MLALNTSRKFRSFLWKHPAYRQHPTGWVLSSLSYGQPGSETTIRFLLWIKEQLKKVSTSLHSQTTCAHCLHAHQQGGCLLSPHLRAWLLAVLVEGGCEQKRQAQCRGVSGEPPAPRMLLSILPLPLSSTALQQQTPNLPRKQIQPSGSSLSRACSSHAESTLK